MTNKLNMKMNSLIKKESLDQSEVFFTEYQTFEEIPLFSRWSNISFLSSYSFNEKNKILIKKTVDVINWAIEQSYSCLTDHERKDYFICLSLTDWDNYHEINCLTPNIYISRRKEWILSCLKLTRKFSIEEYLISEYLSSLGLNKLDVFIPTLPNTEFKRIYVVDTSMFDINSI